MPNNTDKTKFDPEAQYSVLYSFEESEDIEQDPVSRKTMIKAVTDRLRSYGAPIDTIFILTYLPVGSIESKDSVGYLGCKTVPFPLSAIAKKNLDHCSSKDSVFARELKEDMQLAWSS